MKSYLYQSVRTLPPLKDPKHPGMLLISGIGRFSLLLFGILIVIGAYLMATVSLNIELPLNGIIKSEKEIVLYSKPSRGAMIEVGQTAEVKPENGKTIRATVISVLEVASENAESIEITLQPDQSEASDLSFLLTNTGSPVNATIFAEYSLWSFLKDKVEY